MAKKNIQEYLSDKNSRDKIILRCFKDFLIAHHCYGMFKRAYHEGRRTSSFVMYHLDISRTCNFRTYFKELNDKSQLINFAFLWRTTPQGHIFWENQNKRWKALYNRIFRNYQ